VRWVRPRATVGILVVLAAPSFVARAQTNAPDTSLNRAPRVATALTVSTAPVIDGHLTEDVWRDAEQLSGFLQRELHEGEPVTERTEVRLLTDAEALYIGAWLYDRDPAGIVPGEKVRDVLLTNSDYVGIILDTYLDRQNGFVFATTPAGIEYDGQVIKEGEGGGVTQTGQSRAQAGSSGGFNLNWDASWTVATSADSLGWYAEFRIPFSTLRYGGGETQDWGLNVVRSIRRKSEEAFWSFVPRQFSLYRLSRAGTLENIRVPARRVATVTPYVLGGLQRNYLTQSDADRVSEWGIDAKYGLTPSLTLDLTYNTDFAQVEVDEQRTNLTRFPLFFPEKRPFFLENAGTFSSGTPQLVELFFSRRIGISPLGIPVPLIGGGRVTGRVGGFTVGAMQIFSEEAGDVQPATSYSIARLTRELSTRSRVGVIGVLRMATEESSDRNGTFGVDGRIGVGDAWTIDWWGAKTETPGLTGNDLGYSVRGNYQTLKWNNTLRFVQVGEEFNPEVGFLNRSGGYRLYDVGFFRTVLKPEWPWLKRWIPHVNYRGYYGLDDFYQSGQVHIDLTEVEFAKGGLFGPEYNIYHEGLQNPFTIAAGVTLPPGSYNFSSWGLDLSTNPSAPLSVSFRGDFGGLYNGTRNGVVVTVTARKGASLTSSVLVDYQDVELDQGDFIRSLVGVRFGYYFTPRIFALSLVQYSNQARAWTANARFGWLNTAGTGLFIVFNEGREADSFFGWVRPQARSLMIKYTRQIGTGT
jgi:Domain of unknown function (DUF5916)